MVLMAEEYIKDIQIASFDDLHGGLNKCKGPTLYLENWTLLIFCIKHHCALYKVYVDGAPSVNPV